MINIMFLNYGFIINMVIISNIDTQHKYMIFTIWI